MTIPNRNRSIPPSGDQVNRARRHVATLEAKGWTRSAIAQAAGVAPSSISKLCNDPGRTLTRSVVTAVLDVR